MALGGAAAGESLVVEVEVPSRGTLTVAVRNPSGLASTGSAVPVLGQCDGDRGGVLTGRTLSRADLRVEPGTYAFRVAAQDLDAPLHQVDVRTRFVPAAAGGLRPILGGGNHIEGEEDPEEIEVEPDPFRAPGGGCSFIVGEEDPEEIEVEPDPFRAPVTVASIEGEEDPEEIEVEPDPFWGGVDDERSYRLTLGKNADSGLWEVRLGAKGATLELYRHGRPVALGRSALGRLLPAGEYELRVTGSSEDSEPTITATRW